MDLAFFDPDDPDRHLKRLQKVVGISNRIQKIATKRRKSQTVITKEQRVAQTLVKSKEERTTRSAQIGVNQRYILEMISECLGISQDILLDCVADSQKNITLSSDFFNAHGLSMLLTQYQMDDSPGLDSGRFNPKLKNKKMEMAIYSDGTGKKIEGKSIVTYRLKNTKNVDQKNLSEEIFFTVFPEDETVISAVFTSLSKIIRPALEASKEYGNCPEARKLDFLHGVDLFLQFLKSTKDDILTCTINFEVNHDLFKGFLLAPHQIEATSKRRDKVAQIEAAFVTWMKQIKSAVCQGHQLRKEYPHSGPLNELEHWRKMLTKYNNVVEFTDSRPFQSYLKCLKMSRSKLIESWKEIENDVISMVNEARDNVKFMTSIERFWDPLYRCDPLEVSESLPILLQAIRSVYNSSCFYNTPLKMTGFLSKLTNQVIIACQSFLTNRNSVSIWQLDKKTLVNKINDCKVLKDCYRMHYKRISDEMATANESPFDCSDVYLFAKLESFDTRMNKIKEIMDISLRYQILDIVNIAGTEKLSSRIKESFIIISEKTYDPLAYRQEKFDEDYNAFQTEINNVELELKKFVKKYMENYQTADIRLVTLKRFERLNLDCLSIDRRYLDVAVMLEKEIEDIKDKYNEERANPPLEMNMPPAIGRIMWARALLKKIEDPIFILKNKSCVIEHPKAQLCVKYYNYLSGVLIHYELIHHKAWYTYADKVRSKLEMPIIRKNPDTQLYEINLDRYVLQIIKETESMWKLGLEVPEPAQILAYCKHKIINAYNSANALIVRNNKLRLDILPIFLPLMRTQLIKLERIFSPALSTITWLTQNLDEYFSDINDELVPIETFLKEVTDINDAQIEITLKAIEDINLLYLPANAIAPDEFKDLNIKHRQQAEKKVESKSLAAEKAAVELINKFITKTDVPINDNSGKFQLPQEKITDDNWRLEEYKPIDKYDWLSFEKLYKAVGYPPQEVHEKLCFKEYDGLKYDVILLHIDCVELFAFYNHKIVAALVKCTKKGLEMLKKRSNITGDNAVDKYLLIEPLMTTSLELKIPNFLITPKLEEIQNIYDSVILNIIETNYAVSTWGKQAKTLERKTKKPLLDEVRHERHFFKMISEHKEIVRYKMSFDGGLLQKEPEVLQLLKSLSEEHNFLWSENRENEIESFVQGNPLTVDIKEKLILYDKWTKHVQDLNKILYIGPIEIDADKMIQALVEESKAWKTIMGRKLSAFYKVILEEMVLFIATQQKTLGRELMDLDDCRIAMDCLKVVRENFIRIDQSLSLMEDTYAMFSAFHISILPEDTERVDSLRYLFNSMIKNGEKVAEAVVRLQVPLQKELEAGVASFGGDLDLFDEDYVKKGPLIPGISAKEASDRVLMFQSRYEELWRRYEIYSSGEKLFGLQVHEYSMLLKRKREFSFLNKLYSLYLQVMKSIDDFSDSPFNEIDMEKINAEIQDFVNRCRMLPKGMKDWPAFIDLKKKIDDFYESCPLVELMASDAMKERHWKSLENVMNMKFDIHSATFTLGNVIAAPLLKFKDDIEDICVGAIKEKDIESKLKQIVSDWFAIVLTFSPFKTRGDLLIKAGDVLDIVTLLEDSLMVMGSLASNRFNGPFKKEIMSWLQKLSNTNDILEKWLQVQSLWTYLEAVFVGGDIARQLPAEAKRFQNIDKGWVRIMYKARDNPNVIDCCTGDDIVGTTLIFLLDQLEACQKSLTGYLETKRLIFPRFFFVSDPVLLEILGQASDPTSIQPHLLSIFDGFARAEFDEKRPDTIIAMLSANGERVLLVNSVKCFGGVEIWIGKLLESVQDTIRTILSTLAQEFSSPKFDYKEQLDTLCGQATLICVQLLWTKEAEYALNLSKVDRRIMNKKNDQFQVMLEYLVDQTIKDLTKLQRISCETLVTIHVHQRDIFEDLIKKKVKMASDFEWQKQARFYYDGELEEIVVKITDIDFVYQNEYLGVTERLAITPLTDRCYITLSQAIGMCMGGAPAGPAGTGKTETTKDMGRALGKLVVVFNCSDQMDFRGLGRIYKGLAQSGSWGCFDEFNRIELPVLSVAAQQIYIVLNARKEKKKSFIFSDGDTVKLNMEFGIFITMNPGYAGRQELPENLKIQFRTVAMMVPDRQIIMRVKLASCGFRDNVKLAAKFYTLYKLCEEQLSKQVHYDFGLRNILSCLRTLGAEKRRAAGKLAEDEIVMQVLRDMNLSKLVDEDEPLFLSLISDLFPGLKLQTASRKELQEVISQAVGEMNLVNEYAWNLKIIQLYETSLVRHGLMVLGPTGAGKTKCIVALLRSLTIQGLNHREIRMNPKAITAPQMFGRLDVTTNDWTDGIFSVLWRRTLKFTKDFVWLVLDGPVDAVWIENLNSVLDDNKTLTLANGDRIVMGPNCKLVFEPDNVDNASPATVSRMGMVFMSSSVMQWSTIAEGWLKTRPADQAKSLKKFFGKIYGDLHLFVQTKLSAKMKILEAIYIRQTCDLLKGMLDIDEESEPTKYSEAHLERIFLFAVMWSLGAVLELDDRDKMENFVMNHPSKMKWPKLEPGESLFEYLVSNGQWEHWNTQIEEYIYPHDSVPDYSSILVPNVDNVRTAYLIQSIAKQNKSVLLIGEQGTAKTVMIKGYMSYYDPEEHLSKSFNFSSATTPNMFQRIIESYVEKRVGSTYGPPQQRKMTIFIDDINMPVVNEWGDQVTNEIVRQLMEHTGFYSLEKPGDFSTVLDIQILAAMIHPGGGRNDIPPRLKRQFNIFNCTLPSNKSMDKIFGVIGNGYFCASRFNKEVVAFISEIIPLTRKLWQLTKLKMLPTPAKFHYVFNLRDLSRVWGGMLKIETEQCRNKSSLLKLWRHECTRVVADRFTNFDDRNWFIDKMDKLAMSELGSNYEYYPKEDSYFVDFLRDAPDPGEDDDEEEYSSEYFLYEEIPSFDVVKDRIFTFMNQYNLEVRGSKLDMVFFQDALMHLMIISRIIRTARGNALLVGVGGSGKQSLTKLASYIAGYKIHQITLTRSYSISNFADEFKYLYRVAGLQGQGISFIFTDNDIKDEAFLEYLNNVLSSGEIANLFAKDEIDEIVNELIPIMKKYEPKRIPTQDNLYDYFISRARKYLHIVLCFSPVGEKFRNRSLKFPGLISGCMVDWFQKWPMDALVEVSNYFLKDYNIECSPQVKQDLIEIMAFVQDNVSDICVEYFDRFRRQTHVTPKSFLSFLDGYKSIYKATLMTIVDQSEKMTNGLEKLYEAAASIDLLKKQFEIKKEEILEAEVKANVVIENVEKTRVMAETAKAEVAVKQEAQAFLVEKINAAQKIAMDELEKTIPQLQLAEAALKTVKGADIATVRKLGKPPYLITVIMDVVLILFRKKLDSVGPDFEKKFIVTSWAESLKMMSDTSFLRKIIEFKRDLIDAETVDLMQPYFNYPQYTHEAAQIACGNVAGLLKWTKAMADFYKVNKDVLPLKADLAVKQAQSMKAMYELKKLEDALQLKEDELTAAEKEYDVANQALQLVKDDAALMNAKLDAAENMITGLSDERVRWTAQVAQFKEEIIKLVGDVLILTGFLSYTGPFNQEFRAMLQKYWQDELNKRRIPYSSNLNVLERLTDTATIGEWSLQGLPNDELSVQNGIIVTQAPRYPLLIDPQSQGKAWIKRKEKDTGLIVSSLNHKYFRNHLEDAISQGMRLLIEDVGEELDPCLDNVLEKNYIKMGSSFKVKVGDKEVDIHEDFRLFITTKLPNPMYTPEIAARTSIIDFTVTMKGLEDQLLGRVILSERNEIEAERVSLETDVTANKKLSKSLEENLLFKLSTTQGSLLDDLSVMEVLNTSKAKAIEIKEKLESAEKAKESINAAREEFRSVASRGSVLYFLIVKMILVNNMYQTSLVQFLERFDYSLANADKSPITYKRINMIIEYMTYDIFKYKSRGLYETHKFLFALLMALDIDLQRGTITFEEFQNFIKGGAALDINACPPKPFKWITDLTWLNLVQLSTLRSFQNILTHISAGEKPWKQWFEKDAPEEEPIPDNYSNLDAFRKLLIIRSFCIDRTLSQSRKYLGASLGPKYADPVVLNYEEMLEESRPLTPIICFLSMGSDPTPSIESLAKKNKIKVAAISMGQGQEVHARKLMMKSLEEGSWVLLQNCHLGLDYMNELLLQIIELERTAEGFHELFRVWITTEVHPSFPITLLQMSIKFTNEPPSGIKAGMIRTYGSMSLDVFDHSEHKFYLPLIFAVSFLHTVVQERRKFGALGWNIPYEFNSSDWLASCYFLQKHLDDLDPNRGISWETVQYMISEVQYGGRVTDDYDKRLLICFAKTYFSEKFHESLEFFRGYNIVVKKTIEDYLEVFEEMPMIDPPNVYGLHPNADITYQTNKTKDILDTIISVQPKESSGSGGETREASVARQVTDMLQKLPKPYDEFEVKERLTKLITPMNIFLRQEIDRIQKIIMLVKATLNDLLLAIEGTIIMNEQLRDAFDNIYDARVPQVWKRGSWLSSTLGFWFTELIDRNYQFNSWCFKGRPNVFWMTGFFNPQGFLTAMRQETARAQVGWALDKVILQNEVTKMSLDEVKEPPKSGVFVHGLYLDGAGWERKNIRLTEATNKVLYTLMPIIRIYASNTLESKGRGIYECPVYKKSNRTDQNFITALYLKTEKIPEHWILRGVALLCDIK